MSGRSERGWISRHSVGCFYISLYLVLLAALELVLLHRLVPPATTVRSDLIIVTGLMAPLAALAAVFGFMLVGWLVCAVIPNRNRNRKRSECD